MAVFCEIYNNVASFCEIHINTTFKKELACNSVIGKQNIKVTINKNIINKKDEQQSCIFLAIEVVN